MGGELRQFTREGGFAPQLSSDGSRLIYTRPGRDGLWQIPVVGGPEEQLYAGVAAGRPGSWAPAPDGIYHVRFGVGAADPDEIVFHDRATDTTRVLLRAARLTGVDASLALAPDGSWLAYGQTGRVAADLVVVEEPPGSR